MKPKPVLYIDILGCLLVDKTEEFPKAPFAQAFLDAVKSKFRLKFLTSLGPEHAHAANRAFGIEAEHVPYRQALGRASAINFREDFYWVADDHSSADVLRLADERASDRLIPVIRREGVTEATLKKLMATLAEHAISKTSPGG